MEFTIKQKVLNETLTVVRGSLEPKATIAVLTNVLIETMGENAVRITGTDMDITIRRLADAEVKTTGSICLPARKLADVVRTLPDGDCHLAVDKKNWATLTCGRSKYRFGGTSREQFPEVEKFECKRVAIAAGTLSDLISHTSFATSNEASKSALGGGKVEIADGVMRMICCDGYQLALVDREIGSNGFALETLIPKKALVEAAKCDAKEIAFGADDRHIFFETEDQLIVARQFTGQFPNYKMVLPKEQNASATFNAGEFVSAIRRATTMADEVFIGHSKGRSVFVEIKPGEMRVNATSATEGEGEEVIDIEYSGEAYKFRFDTRFLPSFPATFADDTKIKISFKGERDPVEMNIDGDDAYRYTIMPMRL